MGGLPEAVQAFLDKQRAPPKALEAAREVQRALVQGFQSDFAKHAGKINAVHINQVFETVPMRLARAVDTGVGRFRFKGVVPGQTKFAQLAGPIEWLVKAGLLLRVHIVSKPELPLRAYAKDNLFKLYLLDVGLLGCMTDLPHQAILSQDHGSYKGYFAENLVAQELTAVGKTPLYCWQGRQSEVEFLAMEEDRVIPIEVKAGTCARSRSLAAYTQKFAPTRKVKVTARNLDLRGDIHNYPLYLADELWTLGLLRR